MLIDKIYNILRQVTDPEIPVITIHELGILQDVKINAEDKITVFITPTYNNYPAINMINHLF